MVHTPDRMLISETAWQKAVAREAVIRTIAFEKKLTGPERFAACRELDLKPTRFYQHLAQFRRKPVTSSLLDETPSREKGRRLLDFLPFEERVIRRDGLHLFGLKYWDDVLSPWTGAPDKMRVRYDPRDISCVFVDGPNGESWPVRFADLSRPRIALGEHRQAVAALRARGLQSVDEHLIFEIIEAQRQIVEMAGRQTRSVRREAEKQFRALTATEPKLAGITGDADEDDFFDLAPLSVEEWS